MTDTRLIAARALAHQATLDEVVPALRAAGIEPLLIKGAATIALLYDDPNGRDCDDVDLLVRPADFPAAVTLLTQHGFTTPWGHLRPGERYGFEETLHRTEPVPTTLDLHQALMLIPDGDQLNAVLRRDSRPLRVGATELAVPSDAGCALIIALHAAHHGIDTARPRRDLTLACERLSLVVWSQAAALATELGVRSELILALEAIPQGTEIVTALALEPGSAGLQARLRLRGTGGVARWLLAVRSAGDLHTALGILRDGLIPSPAAMRVYYPALAPGRRGLAGGYVRRWAKFPRYGAAAASEAPRVLGQRAPGYLAGLAWSTRAARAARRQLRADGLNAIALPGPPAGRPGSPRAVRHGLRLTRASCLEAALVRREWHLAAGRDIPVVIGARRDGSGFGAHAWLEGDRTDPAFLELTRWPPAPAA